MQIVAIIFGLAFAGYILLFLLFYIFIGGSTRGAVAINKALSNQYYIKDEKIVFASGGNFFNLGCSEIKNADKGSFSVLAQNFAKDKYHVYYDEKILENANPESFILLSDGKKSNDGKYVYHAYSKDNKNVYHFNELIPNLNAPSFELLWGSFTRDCNAIYYDGIKLADSSEEPKFLENDYKQAYLQIENKIYYTEHLLEVSDTDTFQVLTPPFSKDRLHVFSRENIIPDIHPFHFEVLNEHYQKDDKYLYYNLEKIPGSAPDSYQLVKDNFSKDKNQVYFCGQIVMNVEAHGFNERKADSFLNYGRYQNLIYDDHRTLFAKRNECADISSVHLIYKDEIYCFTNRLIGADPQSIRPLTENDGIHAMDNNSVFYANKKIFGADNSTFQVINREFSKDKNHVYYTNKRLLNIKPENFEYQYGMYGNEIDQNTAALVQPNSK